MLILSRRIGETIKIGHTVDVKVLEIRGNQVRIGISAPKALEVHRQEVYDRIQDGEPAPGAREAVAG